MRENMIRLAIKYNGDYLKMFNALRKEEIASESIPLQDAVTMEDREYPLGLFGLKRPPFVLFYRGNKDLLFDDKVAVVGSRNISPYGKEMTEKVVKMLRNKYTIVSGLARGVDSIAHYNAKRTIAVVGNGLDIYYPYQNQQLYDLLFEKQLVISEYPLGVRPLKQHFPFRNRIIAALSKAVIVTQAAQKSGTMHTVNEALLLNRDIYCVPYRYDDPDGAGCNMLIQQGANMIIADNLNDLFDKKA